MNRLLKSKNWKQEPKQCGFITDNATKTTMFMLRIISGAAVQMQKGAQLYFIDNAKVLHQKLFKLLKKYDSSEKDIKITRNLYREKNAAYG